MSASDLLANQRLVEIMRMLDADAPKKAALVDEATEILRTSGFVYRQRIPPDLLGFTQPIEMNTGSAAPRSQILASASSRRDFRFPRVAPLRVSKNPQMAVATASRARRRTQPRACNIPTRFRASWQRSQQPDESVPLLHY